MNRSASSARFKQPNLLDIDVAQLRAEFRTLRRNHHLSQAEIAKLLEVSQATISSFEQGRHKNIRSKTLGGIHEIVSYWRRQADQGTSLHRSIIAQENANPEPQALCGNCDSPLPSLRSPAQYCPTCGTHLVGPCECGYRSTDPQARYCSRCGRPHPNPDSIAQEQVRASPEDVLSHSLAGLTQHEERISRALENLKNLHPYQKENGIRD